jgi:hypothetical protein
LLFIYYFPVVSEDWGDGGTKNRYFYEKKRQRVARIVKLLTVTFLLHANNKQKKKKDIK